MDCFGLKSTVELKDSARLPLRNPDSAGSHRVSPEALQHVVALCHECHHSEVWQLNMICLAGAFEGFGG